MAEIIPFPPERAMLVIDEDHCCAACRHLDLEPFTFVCGNPRSPEYRRAVLPHVDGCRQFEAGIDHAKTVRFGEA